MLISKIQTVPIKRREKGREINDVKMRVFGAMLHNIVVIFSSN